MANLKAPSTSLLSIVSSWLLLSIIFVGCGEDPGVVGSTFVDEGAEVNSDTINVPEFETTPLKSFSGGTPFVSVGEYNDKLFGNVSVTGLFRPRLAGVTADTIMADASIYLSLSIQSNQAYGDTTAGTEFNIIEIAEPWRSNSWRRDSLPSLTDNIIATANVGMEDSVNIKLSDDFRSRYRDYYYYEPEDDRNDNYENNFYGFALVPTSPNPDLSKIIAIDVDKTDLLIRNIAESDTTEFTIGIQKWAYSLVRGADNIPINSDLTPIYSTYENVAYLNFDLSQEELTQNDISRLELAIYENQDTLAATLGPNEQRPSHNKINILLREVDQVNQTLINSQPDFSTGRDSTDFSYRYNLTGLINQVLYQDYDVIDQRYFLTLESNNGILYSTVIHNKSALEKFPKLLITTVKTTTGTN